MEALYEYLSGSGFRGRVEAVVEAFVAMRADLEKEKRATQSQWAKRDKQIDRVVRNMAGMYGDVQGIVSSLPEMEIFEFADVSDLAAEDQL